MIDLKIVRDDPDLVRASQRTRGEDPGLVDALLDADADRRAAIVDADTLRSEQKALGKQVGKAQGDEKQALLAKGKELAEQVKAAVARQSEADEAAAKAFAANDPYAKAGLFETVEIRAWRRVYPKS